VSLPPSFYNLLESVVKVRIIEFLTQLVHAQKQRFQKGLSCITASFNFQEALIIFSNWDVRFSLLFFISPERLTQYGIIDSFTSYTIWK